MQVYLSVINVTSPPTVFIRTGDSICSQLVVQSALRSIASQQEGHSMTDYEAVGLAEGFIEAENEGQIIEAWQHLIDTGLAWRLQGWFGRMAEELIQRGVCHKQEAHCELSPL